MTDLSRDILETIGNTRLLPLRRVVAAQGARILLKLESGNPTGSMKDRMALAMIAAAERDGRLKPGGSVVEYTGGSTGVSLALVCAVRGYPLHIVTSDAFAPEKLAHMRMLGARLQIVPSDTGRTIGDHPSEYARPETIEETAALVTAAGGTGIPVRVDHLISEEVRQLVARIRAEQGRLDILVNDIWGGEKLMEWNKPVWQHDLDKGLRLMKLGLETHLVTAHHALPLLIERPGGLLVEMTDGTASYNAVNYRLSPFYDLVKNAVIRLAWAHAKDLAPHGATSVALTPGWMRSEMMLEAFGVREDNWRDATTKVPHFAISETPRYVGRAVAALAADADRARWNGQSLSSGQLAQVYGFTDLDGSQPDAWRYMVEVQDPDKPADTTGYR